MSNDLVGYSRAGDVFHYRWAARRCLKLIWPNSKLHSVTVEGSPETDKAGEYVIDLTESYGTEDEVTSIKYYQLKHTTVQGDKPFVLSDFRTTLEGFAKRFEQHYAKDEILSRQVSFTIITNRTINNSVKKNLDNLRNGKAVTKSFENTLKTYTTFDGEKLKEFCATLHLEDSEANYEGQHAELRAEMAMIISGAFESAYVDSVTTLMQEKVLPNSNGLVVREEVLRRFGIMSEMDMYPAEAQWETLDKPIVRSQHEELIKKILESSAPVIIHAEGGIGKSVFTRQVVKSLPGNSVGIAYDCFGAGNYRSRSTTRHSHRTALVQIANELAAIGLCDPLVVQGNTLPGDVMRDFLKRLSAAASSLRQANSDANLLVLIDAADNAEMAAAEFNETCFAHELLREKIPTGCRLVFLCRTERIALLQPPSAVDRFELFGFDDAESLQNLRTYFPEAQEQDGTEFHRLTNGNPRVQANALDFEAATVADLLMNLGPGGTTVEDQIEAQLTRAVNRIEDASPAGFKSHVNAICLGLASLSPHIPIDVLARAAGIDVSTVKSFVADIGRPLWISDLSVQFRDEPTETWFRKKYCASKVDFQNYIALLEPLATTSTYVAQMLPQLYLQAEQYEKLITAALSDDFLPAENPIDARSVRVYRLQFALKAALKIRNYKDASKLAIRAGEEMAGEERQLLLLQQNIDLLVLLQDDEKIKEIAFKRLVRGSWPGSENIYSAALLSSVDGYLGEARGFLRASNYWLGVYFEEAKKKSKEDFYRDEERLEDSDVLELVTAQLNINGVKGACHALTGLKPSSAVFKVVKILAERLIDAGKFETLSEILSELMEYPYYVIAITYELSQVGQFPKAEMLQDCLKKLCNKRTRIKIQQGSYNDTVSPAILCFLEVCLHHNLPHRSITKVLDTYFPERASQMVYKSHFKSERELFLGSLAIRLYLRKSETAELDSILPSNLTKKEMKYDDQNELQEFKYVVFGLLPWYRTRLLCITRGVADFREMVKDAGDKSKAALQGRYRGDDSIPEELASLYISILKWSSTASSEDLSEYYNGYLKANGGVRVYHQLEILRISYRLPHLGIFSRDIEQETFDLCKSITYDGPDEIAERFIKVARAVLIHSKEDASVYFEKAVEVVSKFGYEINQRWDALVSLAKQSTKVEMDDPELAYRFIRIAELVGDNVREKHWSRNEAVQLCLRISTTQGIAALSRWLDRDVGRFERLEEALIIELLDSKKISMEIAVSLASFLDLYELQDFVLRCLDKPFPKSEKLLLLQGVWTQLQNEGTDASFWRKVRKACEDEKLSNAKFDAFFKVLETPKQIATSKDLDDHFSEKTDLLNWDEIFTGDGLTSVDALNASLERFNINSDKTKYLPKSVFWKAAVERVSEAEVYDFLEAMIETVDFRLFDLREIFRAVPDTWKSKASFGKKFDKLLATIGQRFGDELVVPYSFDSVQNDLELNAEQAKILQNGVFHSLAAGNEFANAEMLFGFVDLSSQYLNNNEALELLHYALSRFELHVEDDFADGPYMPDNELMTPTIEQAIAGFVFSCLGSPKSIIRWKAAHCVRRLVNYSCQPHVDALFYWLKRDAIGMFGAKKFPFYNLHARQYLLIAFSRSSHENPSIFKPYASILFDFALNQRHVIIQKYARDIAMNVLAYSPEIYPAEEIASLKNVLTSPYRAEKVDYTYRVDSYLHQSEVVERKNKFYFGWDFHQYWFAPLGRVFGVSPEQIEDLASIVAERLWGPVEGGYYKDPRVGLWDNSTDRYSTHHDHGSYPRTDNLDFYRAYNAMMIVAADLLANMPTVAWRDDDDDPWPDWMAEHLMTRDDGTWLSDFRDPVPLETSRWMEQERYDKKVLDISDIEFFESVVMHRNGEAWLNVYGSWQENNGTISGTCHITSAFVSRETSESLLNALSTCVDYHDFKIPAYKERNMEIKSGEFRLTGWIEEPYSSKGIDQFDPMAGAIEYPSHRVGKKIEKIAGLVQSADEKKWSETGFTEPVLVCELYASENRSRDDEPAQTGNVVRVRLSFLKKLCKALQCDLIVEIQLRRNYIHRHSNDKDERRTAVNKIFILSADGTIRDTTESHHLG